MSGTTSVARLPSSAATTNATVAKASNGMLFAVHAYNTTASVKFIKIYNKATAPTVGTDTPVYTFAIGPSQQLDVELAHGLLFSTGISYALTGAAADADATAVAAGDIVALNISYY